MEIEQSKPNRRMKDAGKIEELIKGCEIGDVKLVRQVLRGSNLDLRQINKTNYVVHTASLKGHSSIVTLLLKNGAEVDLLNKDEGWSALMLASDKGYVKVVEILLEKGASVDLQEKDGWSALMLASDNGHFEVVKILLEKGAQVNLQENEGWSALMLASDHGHVGVVEILLKNSAHVDQQQKDGWSALMIASMTGNVEIVKILLEKGGRVDLEDEDGKSILMLTSMGGNVEVLKLLLENGSKVDRVQERSGWSALMMASQEGKVKVVEMLLENGAQVDLLNNSKRSALLIASQNGHDEVVKVLLDYGAQVNLQNMNGESALMTASMYGQAEVVKILLANNAEIDLQAGCGQSALIMASLNGHVEVTKVLLEKGARVDLRANHKIKDVLISSDSGSLSLGGENTRNEKSYKAFTDIVSLKQGSLDVKLQLENGNEIRMKNCSCVEKVTPQHNYCEVINLLQKKSACPYQANDYTVSDVIIYDRNNGITTIQNEKEAKVAVFDTERTALVVACEFGHAEVAKLLLDHGADADLRMSDGRTALMFASENGHSDATQLLLERGAQTHICTAQNHTALSLAKMAKDKCVVHFVGHLECTPFKAKGLPIISKSNLSHRGHNPSNKGALSDKASGEKTVLQCSTSGFKHDSTILQYLSWLYPRIYPACHILFVSVAILLAATFPRYKNYIPRGSSPTLNSKPKLTQFLYFQTTYEPRATNIIVEITTICPDVGLFLEVDKNKIDIKWKLEANLTPTERCRDILSMWLAGQGSEPVTWETFVLALEKLSQWELSRLIRQALEGPNK